MPPQQPEASTRSNKGKQVTGAARVLAQGAGGLSGDAPQVVAARRTTRSCRATATGMPAEVLPLPDAPRARKGKRAAERLQLTEDEHPAAEATEDAAHTPCPASVTQPAACQHGGGSMQQAPGMEAAVQDGGSMDGGVAGPSGVGAHAAHADAGTGIPSSSKGDSPHHSAEEEDAAMGVDNPLHRPAEHHQTLAPPTHAEPPEAPTPMDVDDEAEAAAGAGKHKRSSGFCFAAPAPAMPQPVPGARSGSVSRRGTPALQGQGVEQHDAVGKPGAELQPDLLTAGQLQVPQVRQRTPSLSMASAPAGSTAALRCSPRAAIQADIPAAVHTDAGPSPPPGPSCSQHACAAPPDLAPQAHGTEQEAQCGEESGPVRARSLSMASMQQQEQQEGPQASASQGMAMLPGDLGASPVVHQQDALLQATGAQAQAALPPAAQHAEQQGGPGPRLQSRSLSFGLPAVATDGGMALASAAASAALLQGQAASTPGLGMPTTEGGMEQDHAMATESTSSQSADAVQDGQGLADAPADDASQEEQDVSALPGAAAFTFVPHTASMHAEEAPKPRGTNLVSAVRSLLPANRPASPPPAAGKKDVKVGQA